jgi:hypothetical protein
MRMLLTVTMTIRVLALWNHSRPVKLALVLLLPINLVTPSIVVGYIHATAKITPATPPFTGCSMIASNKFIYLIFLTPLIYETLVIVLTVIKSYPILRMGPISLPVFELLFQDGLAFYCAIVAAEALTLICAYSGNMSLIITVPLSSPALPLAAVACNRLLMRLQSMLIKRDVMALGPRSLTTNGSIGFWNRPVTTTDEFNPGTVFDFERGKRRKRQEELATNWTELVLADLAEHKHQSSSPPTNGDTRNVRDRADQDAVP